MPEPVSITIDGALMVVTLERAHVRNAVDLATSVAIAAAMDRLDADDSLRVGILTGAGGVFSAGGDLDAYHRGEGPYVEGRGFAGLAERLPRKPLVAAVEGYALAGGMELALCCDVLVAGRSARFGIPEVKHGLVAADGGLIRLRDRLSYHQAMALALTGDDISAQRLFDLGIVSEVVDDGSALEAARALAGRIVENAPLAVDASKQILLSAGDWKTAEAFERQRQYAEPVLASADAREGTAAFAERRRPNWSGT